MYDERAREIEENRRRYLEAPHRFYVFKEGSRNPLVINASSPEDAALRASGGACGAFSVHRSGSNAHTVIDVCPAPQYVAYRRR